MGITTKIKVWVCWCLTLEQTGNLNEMTILILTVIRDLAVTFSCLFTGASLKKRTETSCGMLLTYPKCILMISIQNDPSKKLPRQKSLKYPQQRLMRRAKINSSQPLKAQHTISTLDQQVNNEHTSFAKKDSTGNRIHMDVVVNQEQVT